MKLVLAEDQAMVRGALAALLGLEPDIEILAAVGDGEAAWDALQKGDADLLLTDIEMPRLSGLDLALRVQSAKLSVKVVIVTTFTRAGYLRRALDAGVRGYLTSAKGKTNEDGVKDIMGDLLKGSVKDKLMGGLGKNFGF